MIITECYIKNFGCLEDFYLRLDEGINCIYRNNGFGKSTFAAFICAMFYGMIPTRNRKDLDTAERKKYKPWNGETCGGYICFKENGRIYRLERTFADKESDDTYKLIDVETGNASNDFGGTPGEVIFGIDKNAFMSTFFIKQTSIKVEKVNESMISNISEEETFYDDDISIDYEQAIKKLDDAYKIYVKTGNRGYIAELKGKISTLQTELLHVRTRSEKLKKAVNDAEQVILKKAEGNMACGPDKKERERLEWLDDYFSAGIPEEEELYRRQNELIRKRNYIESHKDELSFKNIIIMDMAFVIIIVLQAVLIRPLYSAFFTGIVLFAAACVLSIGLYRKNKRKTDNTSGARAAEVERIDIKLKKIQETEKYIKEYKYLSDREKMYNEISARVAKKNAGEKIIELKRQLDDNTEKQFELSDRIERLKSELSGCREKADIIKKTKEYLKRAKTDYIKDYIRKISDGIRKYFKVFDSDFSEQISINAEYEMNIDEQGFLRQMGYYSSGMKDAMWLCERLAFIELICKGEKSVIIMDDPFVNFDDIMMQHAAGLLEELAKEHQVIYMTCSSARTV